MQKTNEWFLSQLDDEVRRTRRAIEQVPEGKDDWRPHEKSMPLGRLAVLVATMASWVPLVVNRDDLDLNPPGGGGQMPHVGTTRAEMLAALDRGAADARAALTAATEEHLQKPWRLLVAGKVVSEDPRAVVLRDTFAHLAHHRGQLTVYLRLNGAKVPALYGPSADEQRFD